jgi:hypothetical protein
VARLRQPRETYRAIERVNRLVSPLERPDHPEHHYRYDPEKSVAYVATTLAWVGDPAAEGYAREIIARLKPGENKGKWPRRVAAANLDLALALLVTNRLDEACDAALQAILSGCVVPSNHWRAAEVVKIVERAPRGPGPARGIRGADELANTSRAGGVRRYSRMPMPSTGRVRRTRLMGSIVAMKARAIVPPMMVIQPRVGT